MHLLKKFNTFFVFCGLVLLAMATSMVATLCMSGGSFESGAKARILGVSSQLQRIARSVRRNESLDEIAEEKMAPPPFVSLPSPLAGLAFAQSLADCPPIEIYECLLQSHSGAGLHELGIPPGSPFLRRTLSELGLGGEHPLAAVALKRGDHFVIEPPPETRLKKGDVLLVLGKTRDADALRAKLT